MNNNGAINAVQNVEIKHIYKDIEEIKETMKAINESINSLVKKNVKHEMEISELKAYNERFLKHAMFILAVITAVINLIFRFL